jgi:hypothetical protein
VQLVQLAQLGLLDLQAQLDRLAQLDYKARLAQLVRQDLRVSRVRQVHKVKWDRLALKVQLAHKVFRVYKA